MFKKMLAAILMSMMLMTVSAHCLADPVASSATSTEAAVAPMKKGQVAPFDGVLLTPTAVATVTVELRSVSEKIKIAVDRTAEESTAKCDARVNDTKIKADADTKALKAQLEARIKENEVLINRIKTEEKNRPNVMFWTGAGVLGGIAATVLVVVVTK